MFSGKNDLECFMFIPLFFLWAFLAAIFAVLIAKISGDNGLAGVIAVGFILTGFLVIPVFDVIISSKFWNFQNRYKS